MSKGRSDLQTEAGRILGEPRRAGRQTGELIMGELLCSVCLRAGGSRQRQEEETELGLRGVGRRPRWLLYVGLPWVRD